MPSPPRRVECTIPILPVRDLQQSIRFYVETLEFQLDWGGEAGSRICSVSQDGCSLMLSEITTSECGVWVWIGVEDESLFNKYRERGVKIRQEPKNFSWAYEMKFEDPDGNVLWLGTEPRRDLPLDD